MTGGGPGGRSGPGALFGERGGPRARGDALQTTQFAHPSERLFAQLLDFYGIAWQYEPRSFDLAWDEDGQVVERFTPDFYLPEYDLYVEITTMSQKLVTRKNRKIRRLRELYPHVRCRIFYQRDLSWLAAKHGIELPVTPPEDGGEGA